MLDVDGINDGSKKINKKLDSIADKLEYVGSKLKSALGTGLKSAVKIGVAALTTMSTAVVGLGKIGLEYNSQIEDYTVNFTTMLGDAEKGAAKVQELKELAASTPFALSDLAESTQTLLAFNVASDESTDILSMLGDISLGNADKLSRLSTAYGKVNSTGKLTGETLQQMIEAGFNPALVITQETGETMEEFNKRVSDGGVSVDELRKAMVKATSKGGQFNNGMKNASKTMSGLISTLKDNAISLVGDVFKPISDSLTNDLLPKVIDSVGELQRAFDTGGVNGLVEAAGNMLGDYIAEFSTLLPKIGDLASGLVTSLIDGIKNNAGQIATGAAELVETFVSFIVDAAPEFVDAGFELAINLANGLAEKLPELIPDILLGAVDLIISLVSNLPGLFEAGVKIIAGIAEGVLFGIPNLIATLGAALFGISDLSDGLFDLTAMYNSASTGASKLTEETIGVIDAALDATDAYADLKKSVGESVSADLSQLDYVQRLYGELENLVDANGRVKEGYETRVNYILNELNGALDTEYKMNDNIILQYGEMKSSIEDVILAKKAQILLEAQEEVYRTAVQNVAEAERARAAQLVVLTDAEEKLANAEELLNLYYDLNADQMYYQAGVVADLREEKEKQREEYEKLSTTLYQYYLDISKYETASGLIIEGETQKAVENLRSMGDGFIYASDIAGKSAEEQKKTLEDQVITTEINAELMKDAYIRGVEGVTEEMVKTAENQALTAKEEFKKVGGTVVESIGDGAQNKKYVLNQDVQDVISSAVATGKKESSNAKNIGKMMMQGLRDGLNNQKQSLIATARSIAQSVTAAFKARLQIHSPSRVFRDEIGAMMAKGLGEGFEAQMPKELRAMNAAINLGAITTPMMASGTVVPPQSSYSVSRNSNSGIADGLSRQISAATGNQNRMYQFVAQIDGTTVFNKVIREGQMRQVSSGRNPFEL